MIETLLNIVFLIVGLLFLIKGSDIFVEGSVGIAKKFKISSFIIGLTIVSFGTSAPELSVSLASAISGSSDISVGNIIGSNIFNILVVLGFSAVFVPISVKSETLKKEFPFLLMISIIFLIFIMDNFLGGGNNLLSRGEGIVLIILLILYLFILIKTSKPSLEQEDETIIPVWKSILFFLIGLALVVTGGEFVTSTSRFLAIKIGMSETLVGLTVVALGTSLPELVTSIVAAKKGENEIALGNVIGSNIFNILLILGLTSSILPLSINNMVIIDSIILLGATILVHFFSTTKKGISRIEGLTLLLIYAGYLVYIILRNYL